MLTVDAVDWRLYFVTDTALCGGLDRVAEVAEQAILGGAGVVQVRDKDIDDVAFADLARSVVAARDRAFDQCGRRAAIVVNDRLSVAADLGLHFHQGQDDGDIRQARHRLGNDALIGLSISNAGELAAHLADPVADVVGLSPVYATPTKTDTAAPLGLLGTAHLAAQARGHVATVAIGGINTGNARQVIATGVDGICVVSAIACAPDPRAAAAELLSNWSTQ